MPTDEAETHITPRIIYTCRLQKWYCRNYWPLQGNAEQRGLYDSIWAKRDKRVDCPVLPGYCETKILSDIVSFDPSATLLVEMPTGSGKSVALLHRSLRLAEMGSVLIVTPLVALKHSYQDILSSLPEDRKLSSSIPEVYTAFDLAKRLLTTSEPLQVLTDDQWALVVQEVLRSRFGDTVDSLSNNTLISLSRDLCGGVYEKASQQLAAETTILEQVSTRLYERLAIDSLLPLSILDILVAKRMCENPPPTWEYVLLDDISDLPSWLMDNVRFFAAIGITAFAALGVNVLPLPPPVCTIRDSPSPTIESRLLSCVTLRSLSSYEDIVSDVILNLKESQASSTHGILVLEAASRQKIESALDKWRDANSSDPVFRGKHFEVLRIHQSKGLDFNHVTVVLDNAPPSDPQTTNRLLRIATTRATRSTRILLLSPSDDAWRMAFTRFRNEAVPEEI